jgi:hypothetical protein
VAVGVIAHRRLHRVTFCAAAVYNMSWGVLIATRPFGVLTAHASREVIATLGMVIGLYGVVFAEIARRPETGFVPAAVGFTGKLLGTIGLAVMIATGSWPPSSFLSIAVPNDIAWLVPFGLYLYDARAFFSDSLRNAGWGRFGRHRRPNLPQIGADR